MTSARILLLCAVSSLVGLSSGLWLGGDEKDTLGVGSRPSQQGFERNADVYSHLIIPPWSRPFKIGYCKSWEWSTDKRWRDTRLDICENYGKGKHECDSPSGCHDKCPYVNGSYPFWRLRNGVDVPFLWVISGMKFYETSSSSKSLATDPSRAYSSSYFGPGYKPSNAFDNNRDTIWVSNGAAPPGMQWIGYEFPYPVFVGSIHLMSEEDKPERNPSMIYVEASCEKYFKNFVTQWIISNPSHEANKKSSVFNMAKFTNVGTTGRKGPTTVGMHYQGQNHDGQVTVKKGIQIWKVPATGTYAIEAAGAAGGYDKFTTMSKRSRGARVKGNFHLKRGALLKILVGQEGGVNMVSGGAGGGGGTFVVAEDNTPLLVAGGGGGIDKFKGDSPRCHGTTSHDGNPGYGGAQFRGGSNGKGAQEGDNNYSGGGGGGFESDGRSNSNFGGSQGTGGEGGKSFYHGGTGGRSKQNDVDGGFGGGGGPNGAGGGGGGGGGYSGGASGSKSNSCGGGGGSFNSGTDQSSQAGVNVGQGYVIVKLLTLK